MSQDFLKTNSGILVPQKKPIGYRCGFCPEIIFQHKESGNKVRLSNGKPICPRCRILRGRFGKQIMSDKKAYLKDIDLKEKMAQEKANQNAIKVAEQTQRDTKTKIKK